MTYSHVHKPAAIDLHVHSNRSDGTYSPRQLVDYAMEKGLRAFALTDHDTVDGLDEAVRYAHSLKDNPSVPEVIPGIELSTQYQGQDIHIVGLYIDYKNPEFLHWLKRFTESRTLRNHKMCALLKEAGVEISYDELLKEFPDAVITRAHYAKYLLRRGYVKSIKEAFDRYVGDHCPCFVPREKVTPEEAVELILKADGIPVLAHPALYHMSDSRMVELISLLKEKGLMGIEAVYSTYHAGEERFFRALARKYHLLVSGGSDFHGPNKPGLDLGTGYGRLFVSEELLTLIRQGRKNLLFTDLDGTLLLKDSTVSDAMKQALERMTQAGHRLILTSGRPLPSILEVCGRIGLTENRPSPFPNMMIIANNGALIYDCSLQAPILEHRIAPEDIAFLEEKARQAGLHMHGYSESEIICTLEKENAELQFYRQRIHMPVKYVPNLATALPHGSYKLQVIHLTDHEALEQFRSSLLSCCEGRLQFIFSNDKYLEILPASAGKGNALRFVTDYLPAPRSHTFAAGDAENDISMLQAAHVGIAMRNASLEVKKAARLITRADNDHDGLLEVLNQYFV